MSSYEVIATLEHEKESKYDAFSGDDEMEFTMNEKQRHEADFLCIVLTSVCILAAYFGFHDGSIFEPYQANHCTEKVAVPTELLGYNGLYKKEDFVNHKGIKVPYWEEFTTSQQNCKEDDDLEDLDTHVEVTKSYFRSNATYSSSAAISVTPDTRPATIPHFGPCYLPSNNYQEHAINLHSLKPAEKYNVRSASHISYPEFDAERAIDDNSNLCRPGFVIIGAGKCGTSSLYQYIVGHPRVLPAKEKQVHYFKNATHLPMSWYLSHFPSTETFLSHGALMTGEASPGYLPRPDVAFQLQDMMRHQAGNGYQQQVHTPKIITAVRNPLERSFSSFNYNYARPGLKQVKEDYPELASYMTDKEISEKYLFSFEQMIKAELDNLKECLKPGGIGEQVTKQVYGRKPWALSLLQRKESEGKSLIAIDDACYGDVVSPTLPRKQWKALVEEYPEKLINVPNFHTVQAMIGRSLFVLPLEWWYALYPREDMYVVCNEDLKYHGDEELSKVSDFLGLPAFDFSGVVNEGMFNVGGNFVNVGYDTLTKVEKNEIDGDVYRDIPISEELKMEYLSFVKPFNERLYDLIGKRCNW